MSLLKVAKNLIWQLHNNKAFYHLERVSFTSQKSKTKSLGYQKCLVAFLPLVAGLVISLMILAYEIFNSKPAQKSKTMNVKFLIVHHKSMALDIKKQIELLDEEITALEHHFNRLN